MVLVSSPVFGCITTFVATGAADDAEDLKEVVEELEGVTEELIEPVEEPEEVVAGSVVVVGGSMSPGPLSTSSTVG